MYSIYKLRHWVEYHPNKLYNSRENRKKTNLSLTPSGEGYVHGL